MVNKRCPRCQGRIQAPATGRRPRYCSGACRQAAYRKRHRKLHGPYAYRFYRQGNRLRKVYVRKALADQVTEACEARRAFRRQVKASWQEWRDLLAGIREAESP